MSIQINVVNQKMVASYSAQCLIEGSQQFVKFRFNFNEDWEGLTIFAQFAQNGVAYNQYLDNENSVFLPSEIKAGTCTLMLYGTRGAGEDTTIGTSNYLTFKVGENNLIEDASSTDISESLYSQLVERVDKLIAMSNPDGADGFSPTVTVAEITGGHRISITDSAGTKTFDVMNGADGSDGQNGSDGQDGSDGADGFSPTVTVTEITGGHRVSITDSAGTKTFDVMNGADGSSSIDSTYLKQPASAADVVFDAAKGARLIGRSTEIDGVTYLYAEIDYTDRAYIACSRSGASLAGRTVIQFIRDSDDAVTASETTELSVANSVPTSEQEAQGLNSTEFGFLLLTMSNATHIGISVADQSEANDIIILRSLASISDGGSWYDMAFARNTLASAQSGDTLYPVAGIHSGGDLDVRADGTAVLSQKIMGAIESIATEVGLNSISRQHSSKLYFSGEAIEREESDGTTVQEIDSVKSREAKLGGILGSETKEYMLADSYARSFIARFTVGDDGTLLFDGKEISSDGSTVAKTWVALGDSKTDFNNNGVERLDNYPKWIQDRNPLITLINLGSAGGMITNERVASAGSTTVLYPSVYAMAQKITGTPDIITVAGGYNDWNWAIPLGVFTTDISDYITDSSAYVPDPRSSCERPLKNTFYKGVFRLAKYLTERFPLTPILWITPFPTSTNSNGGSNGFNVCLPLIDYVNAIKDVCAYFSIPVCDMYSGAGLTPFTESTRNAYWRNGDGVHPNGTGSEIYSYKIERAIRETYENWGKTW